jgi:hypothetical protein
MVKTDPYLPGYNRRPIGISGCRMRDPQKYPGERCKERNAMFLSGPDKEILVS